MMQVKDRFADSDGNIDENQLADDLSLYLDDYENGEQDFHQTIQGMVNEFMRRVER